MQTTQKKNVRLAERNWLQLRGEITARHLGVSPAFFDKHLFGQRLEVLGTDDFYYVVRDPSNRFSKPLLIHTNHIIK